MCVRVWLSALWMGAMVGCGNASGTPLVLSEVAASEDCPAGGVVITTGQDADGDGQLTGSEVDQRTVICDGEDAGSLVLHSEPAADDACPGEGRLFRFGYDTSGDGVPDTSVVEEVVCDGPMGTPTQAVTQRGDFPCTCAMGGLELSFGYDTTGDGLPDDLTHTEVLCDPAPGGVGPAWPSQLPCEPFMAFSAWGTGTGSQVWLSDGTPSGTRMLPAVHTGLHEPFSVSLCTAFGFDATDCDTFERHFCELTGSTGGHCGLPASAAPDRFILYDGHLYFTAEDGEHGRELWRSDGVEVERVTDLNPSGSSFYTIEYDVESERRVRMAVFDGALYFVATNGSPLTQSYSSFVDGLAYQLYRFTNADGLSQIPFADPNVEWVREYLTVSGGALYVTAQVGDDRDIFRYLGSGAAEPMGVPPLAEPGGNGLMHLDAARDGLYFQVRTASAIVAGLLPTRFGPFGVTLGGNFTGPPTTLSLRATMGGRVCGVGSNGFYCYTGRVGPLGVQVAGPASFTSAVSPVVVDDERFCFWSNVSGSSDRMFCTDGIDAPATIPGAEGGTPLGGADGVLYHRCGTNGGLCALDFASGTVDVLDTEDTPLWPAVPFAGPGSVLFPLGHENGFASELRWVDLATGAAQTLPLRSEGASYPQRITVFSPGG